MDITNSLYNDQSVIQSKMSSLHSLMFTISYRTSIHPIVSCILYFIKDIQLIYFVCVNKNIITLNEKISSIIAYMGLDIDFKLFSIISLVLNSGFLTINLIMFTFIFFINPRKYKENFIIKILRIGLILYSTVLFPIFTHTILKALPSKNGKLTLFPGVEYLGGQHYSIFIISVISLVIYLTFQIPFFSFIYVNPTTFNKNNSLCQNFSYINLKYNIFIFILSLITIICKSYSESALDYIIIIILLYMLYAINELLNIHPYYNKYINIFRAGMWTMITGTTIIDIIAFVSKNDQISFDIVLIIFGIISFFIGIGLYRHLYMKHINNIYKRFKAKKIERNLNKSFSELQSASRSLNSSENEDNNEKLISFDSSNSDEEEDSEEENNKKDSDEENSSYYSEYDNNVILDDKITERITSFGSIREIMDNRVSNEPVIVFKNINDFELACRYIRNNETKDAFILMKEIYSECIDQFKINPFIFTYYSYYLIYMEEKKIKINDQEIEADYENSEILDSESEQNNVNQETLDSESEQNKENLDKIEEELNNDDYEYLLRKAISSKLNPWGKYFVKFLIFNLREKQHENIDYYEREAKEKLVYLQNKAVENHVIILNLYKKFYNYIIFIQKNSSDSKNFNFDKLFKNLSYLKHETFNIYQEIIEKYPDEKGAYQLYGLFLKDVINNEEDEGYALNEEESYLELNSPNKITKGNSENKLLGSTASLGISKSVKSSTVGDNESKRKKLLKKKMLSAFLMVDKRSSHIIILFFVFIFILFLINLVYCFLFLNGFNQNVKDLKMIGDMNYNVDRLLRRSRIIGFFLMENNEKKAEKIREGILETIVRLETKYIPVLVKYSLDEVSDVPVIIYYNTNEGLKSSYAHYNGYELMKEIIVWSKSLYNTPSEELIRRAKNGSSIFDDYRYRMFSDNIKDRSYNNIMKETFLKIYNEANDYQNSKILVIYIFTVVIVVLSLVINIFGLTPLHRNITNIRKKTLKILKCILKGSLKDIVSRFEDSIESITQIYDINYDDKKKKFENVENNGSFMNYIYDMQGYLINILILFTALLIAIPIITKKYYMDKRVNFNLSTVERKEMIIDLNLYGLETIIQDMKAFVAGSPESLLNNKIIELETIQNKIYLGQLNIESTTKIKELNSLLVNNNCKLDESICESLEEIPEIDFTKNMVKLGLNELIDEYLTKSKSILNKSQIKKYKNEKYIYHYEYENNRFKNYCLNDSDFRFQYEVISHCINGLDKFYTILFDSLFENVRSTIYTTIYCSLIGLVLLSISIIISRKSIKTSNKVLREMVDLIFIIPTSTINMVPQLKKFIETASFEED